VSTANAAPDPALEPTNPGPGKPAEGTKTGVIKTGRNQKKEE